MYISKKVKCADCGDIFKIEYDSHKKLQDTYSCKCGKLRCRMDSYGSFSYHDGGNYEKIEYEDSEYTSYYYDEDFIKLTHEANYLMEEINELGNQLGKKIGISFYNMTDDDHISLEIDDCNSAEYLSIKVDIDLVNRYGWRSSEKIETENRIIEALSRFKDIIAKSINGEIDLDKPRKIWDDNSLEWYDGTREQQKLYDYELYC